MYAVPLLVAECLQREWSLVSGSEVGVFLVSDGHLALFSESLAVEAPPDHAVVPAELGVELALHLLEITELVVRALDLVKQRLVALLKGSVDEVRDGGRRRALARLVFLQLLYSGLKVLDGLGQLLVVCVREVISFVQFVLPFEVLAIQLLKLAFKLGELVFDQIHSFFEFLSLLFLICC